MSYTYLLEQGEESSAGCFSDIPQSVLSRLNLTAEKSCSKDNETASCQSSQSGMMSAPSTELRGEEKSISYAEDSLAKTSQQQAKEQGSQVNEADSGERWPESLAKYDQDSRMWRTAQCLLFEDSTECLAIFPKWGMMHDGECWEQSTQVLRTDEIESGLWPTATAGDSKNAANRTATRHNPNSKHHSGTTLVDAVRMWPTPTAQDSKNNGAPSQMVRNTKPLNAEVGGSLNPTWVEWLMGWPLGWTDSKPLEMDKFQQWLLSHGELSKNRS